MSQNTFIFACLCSAAVIAVVIAVPLPASNQELDVLQIPLTDGKELDVLTVGARDQEQMIEDRNKRTIGLLRELFPDITKQIDSIVNRIIAQVIRVLGPSLLPTLLGNRPTTAPRSNFDADFDDFDSDDTDANNTNKNEVDSIKSTSKSNSSDDSVRVQIDLPTFAPDNEKSTSTVGTTTSVAKKVSLTATVSSTTITTNTPTIVTPLTTSITSNAPPTSSMSETSSKSSTITTRMINEPKTTLDYILEIPKTIKTRDTTQISFYPLINTTSLNPIDPYNTKTNPTLPTPLATTLAIENTDTTQVTPRVDNFNRFLNSTNFIITTRDNLTTSSTTTISTISSSTETTMPTPIDTTVKITKLYPNGATDTQIDLSAINKQLEETIRVARQVKEAEAAASAAAAVQAQQVVRQQAPAQLPIPQSPLKPLPEQTIQLSFNNEVSPLTTSDSLKAINNDLQLTDSKSPAIDELTLESNEDTADLDDRNKRFLSFGGAGLAGGSSGGSGGNSAGGGGAAAPGGSGNFLFDIIRLFSGSVQTQAGDEAANSGNSVSGSSDDTDTDSDANRAADGYTEGIPGPVTRLVVLANRGLANLIQDLILRIAATSEKFVNFKAKLITALI